MHTAGHQLVAHPSETVRLPWQVYERGTVYRQLSAQPPHRLLALKKNLNHFCLDCHSVCDNVYCLLAMFSALAAVCTVYCAIEIVLITLHYITLLKYSAAYFSKMPICPSYRNKNLSCRRETAQCFVSS